MARTAMRRGSCCLVLGAILIAALGRPPQEEDQAVLQVADEVLAARNSDDFEAVLNLFADDAVASTPREGPEAHPREDVRQVVDEWMRADEVYSAGPTSQIGADSIEWNESVIRYNAHPGRTI